MAMLAREAVMQQQEYEEAVRHAMVEMEREEKEAGAKSLAAKHHREALQSQIEASEAYRKRHQGDKFEEDKVEGRILCGAGKAGNYPRQNGRRHGEKGSESQVPDRDEGSRHPENANALVHGVDVVRV